MSRVNEPKLIVSSDLSEDNADNRCTTTNLGDFLLAIISRALDEIIEAYSNVDGIEFAASYSGVTRAKKAIEKLELAFNHGKHTEIQPLSSLLSGKVVGLNTWHEDTLDFLSSGNHQIKDR